MPAPCCPPPRLYKRRGDSPQSRGLRFWYPISPVHRIGGMRCATRPIDPIYNGGTWGSATTLRDTSFGRVLVGSTTNTYVTFGTADFSGLANASFSAWGYPFSSSGSSMIFSKHNSSTSGSFYLGQISLVGRFTLICGGVRTDLNAGTLIQNYWNHIVGTYDGALARIYVNGRFAGSIAQTAGAVNNIGYPLRLLNYDGLNWDWNGMAGDFRIYERCLSASEVLAMYQPATRWDLYEPIDDDSTWLGRVPAVAASSIVPKIMYEHRQRL